MSKLSVARIIMKINNRLLAIDYCRNNSIQSSKLQREETIREEELTEFKKLLDRVN